MAGSDIWIPVRAQTKGFIAEVVKAASGAGRQAGDAMGGEMERGGRAAGQRAGRATADGITSQRAAIERASQTLAAARDAEKDAAGAVRIAEEKLAEVRQNADASASKVASAEENLANAQRRNQTATEQAARASAELDRVRTGSTTTSRTVIRAEEQLATAKNNAAKADGAVRVAQLQLNEVRANSSSTAAQIATAEERLDAARRKATASADQVRTREAMLNAARADSDAAATRAAAGNDNVAASARRAGDAMSTAGSRTGGFGVSLTGMAAKAAGAAAALTGIAGIGSVLKSGFDRLMTLERADIMFRNIGLSADETKQTMADLNDVVTGTSVSMADAAKISSLLMQAGVEAGKPLNDSIRALTNISAVSGAAADDIGMVLMQIKASGKLLGGDAMQLTGRGVNIYGYLADNLGKSFAEVKKMGEDGQITYEMVIDAINNKTGSLAKEMGETLPAKLGNLKTAFATLGAEALSPLIGPATDFATKLVNGVKNLKPVLQDVTGALGTFGGWIRDNRAWIEPLAVGIGAAAAAWKAWTIATRLWTTATQTATAIQMAFNAATRANVIGIIVLAIIGLVAGLIYAYKRFEGFRNLVNGVWNAIKTGAAAIWGFIQPILSAIGDGFRAVGEWIARVWTDYIRPAWDALVAAFRSVWAFMQPIFGFIGQAFQVLAGIISLVVLGPIALAWNLLKIGFQAVGTAISFVWNSILKPVFDVFATVITWLWTTVLQPVFGFIWLGFQTLGTILAMIWNSVIKPIFDVFGAVARWLWTSVIMPVFGFIRTGFNVLGGVFRSIWEGVIKPVWDALGNAIRWVWDTIVSPVWENFKNGLSMLGDAFRAVWDNVIKPAWDALGNGIRWVWENIIQRAFDGIGKGVQALGKIFTTIGSVMKGAFDGVVDVLKSPIHAVGRLLASIPDKVLGISIPGVSTIKSWGQTMQSLATGGTIATRKNGMLNGPGDGLSDSIIGVDAAGVPIVRVATGEFVVNAAATAKWLPVLQAINNGTAKPGRPTPAGPLPGLASGGRIDREPYGMPNGTSVSYGAPGFPQWVYDMAAKHGVQASTYPGHQESDRNEAGYAPNPEHLNRGIDWSGPVDKMQSFAEYLLSIAPDVPALEQIIWQNPNTGNQIGWHGRERDDGSYFANDYSGHTDHVHSRQAFGLPATAPAPEPEPAADPTQTAPEDVTNPTTPDTTTTQQMPDTTTTTTTATTADAGSSGAKTWGQIAGMAVTEQMDDLASFIGIKDTWMYDPSKIGMNTTPKGDQSTQQPDATTGTTQQPGTPVAPVPDGAIDPTQPAIPAEPAKPKIAKVAPGKISMGKYGTGADFYVKEAVIAAAERGFDENGAAIGVATQLVEAGDPVKMWANASDPETLTYPHDAISTDYDSSGTFQQRNNGAWGTAAQRMNARGSASMFFNELAKHDWQSMDPGAAAQAVQRSAFPDKYGAQIPRAHELVKKAGVYDRGGILPHGGIAMNLSGRDEYILDPDQSVPIITPERRTIDEEALIGGRGADGAPLVGELTINTLELDEALRKMTRELRRLSEADALAGGRIS